MLRNKNVLLFGSIGFIVLAIGLVTILDRFSSPQETSTDVRARAAVTNTLQLHGTVSSVDEAKGTVTLSDVYFADASRSGDAKNLGVWTVTAPPAFNFASVAPGMFVTVGVDAKTFLATSHTVTALTLVPESK